MSFTFNNAIPASANNPSVDQPGMLTNNQSTQLILAVDHVTFNTSGSGGPGASGGQHLQVTFNSKNTPAAPTDPIAVLYTGNGIASAVAQGYFRNQNATLPMTSIVGFVSFASTAAPTAPTLLTQYNIASVTHAVAPNYIITLTAGATTGNNVAVFISVSNTNAVYTYSFTGGVLTLNYAAIPTVTFSILFIQI